MNYELRKKLATPLIAVFLFFCFLVFLPQASQAQLVPQPKNQDCPDDYEGNCGDYELNDFTRVFINSSQIVLGVVGAITLLFFVYGGVKMIISSGSSEKIEEAKNIIKNAVIGLFIVFISWTIINFVFYALRGGNQINDKPWYQLF